MICLVVVVDQVCFSFIYRDAYYGHGYRCQKHNYRIQHHKFHLNLLLNIIGLLSVVSEPFTVGELHIGKGGFEGGILRAAGIDAKADRFATAPHMADPHLLEFDTVHRAFDAIIILSAAESIPH